MSYSVATFLAWLRRTDTPGMRIVETWDHTDIRVTCCHDVTFSDVPVELDQVVLKPPATWLNDGPGPMAWINAEISAPLSTVPRVQEQIGEAKVLLQVNGCLIGSVLTETDLCVPTVPTEAVPVKAMVSENAIRAMELATSPVGQHAHARVNAIKCHLRDVSAGHMQAPPVDAAFIIARKAVLS
jgi:alkylation response protein AidB-like acyl-CoA dehydrogenase